MNSVLRKALASIPQVISNPYVFSGEPDKWFRELCEKPKIDDFTWHDLRHTFASRLVMKGVPIRAVAELMGHSEITTTMRYAHRAPRYLADAVERLAEADQPFTGAETKAGRK